MRARVDGEIGDRRDGGQRLAAKAERRDIGEIAVRNFGCRVTLDGEREIVLVHAAAVIDDADEPAAAFLDRDVDARRARVERVLDQLLDGGGGTLDHFAGGDAVDENGIETANGHGQILDGDIIHAQRRLRRLDQNELDVEFLRTIRPFHDDALRAVNAVKRKRLVIGADRWNADARHAADDLNLPIFRLTNVCHGREPHRHVQVGLFPRDNEDEVSGTMPESAGRGLGPVFPG